MEKGWWRMWVSVLHHNLESPHHPRSVKQTHTIKNTHTHCRWRWPIGTLHHVYECMWVCVCDALIVTSQLHVSQKRQIHTALKHCADLCVCLKSKDRWHQNRLDIPAHLSLKLMEINPPFAENVQNIWVFTVTSVCTLVFVHLSVCCCTRLCVWPLLSPPCSLSPGRVLLLPYWEYDGLPLPLPAMS